jgi:hypothetical protein
MRNAFVLILVLLSGNSTFAQLKIGITVFPQISSTSSIIPFKKDVVNNKNLPTFTGGAGIVITKDSYHKPRGFQFGISYSSQNQNYLFNYKVGGIEDVHRGKKRFDYIKASLVLRKFGYVHKYVKSIFFIGPQFSYLLKYDGGAVVYKENEYFDLPATSANLYYKKYSIDAVAGWALDYAIHKNFDVFAALRLDYGINNIEIPGVTYNGYKVFSGGGSHQITYGLHFGAYYVFHRQDHLLLPTNTWRFRVYKKKGIPGLKTSKKKRK